MVYLLEDDENIRELAIYALRNTGIPVQGFALPSEFWTAMRLRQPNIIILDIMLPEEDGLSVLKRIRSRVESKTLPVIMLTAKGTEYDKIIGLDSGADDYITKPFSVMELISRIKAILRRSEKIQNIEYKFEGLYVCPSKHIIKIYGNDVSLTLKEFEILSLLIQNAGTVITREKIFCEIWGYNFDGENRTLDVHIRTLRNKLDKYGDIIETVRGKGYKLKEY